MCVFQPPRSRPIVAILLTFSLSSFGLIVVPLGPRLVGSVITDTRPSRSKSCRYDDMIPKMGAKQWQAPRMVGQK